MTHPALIFKNPDIKPPLQVNDNLWEVYANCELFLLIEEGERITCPTGLLYDPNSLYNLGFHKHPFLANQNLFVSPYSLVKNSEDITQELFLEIKNQNENRRHVNIGDVIAYLSIYPK